VDRDNRLVDAASALQSAAEDTDVALEGATEAAVVLEASRYTVDSAAVVGTRGLTTAHYVLRGVVGSEV
jgi:hypothetical protein